MRAGRRSKQLRQASKQLAKEASKRVRGKQGKAGRADGGIRRP